MDYCECSDCAKTRKWLVIVSSNTIISAGSFLDDPNSISTNDEVNSLVAQLSKDSFFHAVDFRFDPILQVSSTTTLSVPPIGPCVTTALFQRMKETLPYIEHFVNPLYALAGLESGARVLEGKVIPWTQPLDVFYDPITKKNYMHGYMNVSLRSKSDFVDTIQIVIPYSDATTTAEIRIGETVYDVVKFYEEERSNKRVLVARLLEEGLPTISLIWTPIRVHLTYPIEDISDSVQIPPSIFITYNSTVLPHAERRAFAVLPMRIISPKTGKNYLVHKGILAEETEGTVTPMAEEMERLAFTETEKNELRAIASN